MLAVLSTTLTNHAPTRCMISALLIFATLSSNSLAKGESEKILESALPLNLNSELSLNRQRYREAVELLDSGSTKSNPVYLELRQQLSTYPLASYLDYLALQAEISALNAQKISSTFSDPLDQKLASRLHKQRLERLARSKNWEAFIQYHSELPKQHESILQSNKMACTHATALYRAGQQQQAFTNALDLWKTPRSMPKACDAIFHLLQSQGLIPGELAKQRFLAAFAKSRFQLARYLTRFMQVDDERFAKQLLALYQTPERLPGEWPRLTQQLTTSDNATNSATAVVSDSATAVVSDSATAVVSDSAMAKSIVFTLTKRLARRNAAKAAQFVASASPFESSEFNDQTLNRDIRDYIIQRVALKDYEDLEAIYQKLGAPQSDKSLEWRLRAYIAGAQWPKVVALTQSAPDHLKQQNRWQYWSLRAQQLNQTLDETGEELFHELAKGANFYAFSAAHWLQQPASISPVVVEQESLLQKTQVINLPSVQRAIEHFYHGETLEANRNWNTALKQLDSSEFLSAAYLAASIGWDEKAIYTAARAKAWQHYALRFPQRYSQAFELAAARYYLPPHWFYATARQESALAPKAKSHAGAVGLMQLLPSTANQVAHSLGVDYKRSLLYNPEYSIQLGTAYLSNLYQRYGNRIISSAAYNAGPGRVDRWLKSQDTQLPVDAWIETIRYSETRQYVQNVLSFSAINFMLHHQSENNESQTAWNSFNFYASNETVVHPFEEQIMLAAK